MTNEVTVIDHSADVPSSFGISATLEMNTVAGSVKQGMKEIGRANDMFMVHPGKLRIKQGFNTRVKDDVYWAGIAELAESIRKNGFYKDKPLAVIVVKEGGENVAYVVEGGRRYDASMMVLESLSPEERETFCVPVVAKDRETSELDLTYGLAQGNNAKGFRPYEMAVLVKRLKQVFGQSEAQILERLDGIISASYLTNLLIVAGAPRQIAEMVLNETISVTQAAKIMNEHGDKAIDVILKAKENSGGKKITDRFMPGRKLERAVKKESSKLYESAKAVINDAGFAALSEDTRKKLQELMRELAEHEDECVIEGLGSTDEAETA